MMLTVAMTSTNSDEMDSKSVVVVCDSVCRNCGDIMDLSFSLSLCLSFDCRSEIIWHAADCVVILVVFVVFGVWMGEMRLCM